MQNLQNPNLEILTKAVEQLDSLVEQMVFLGGCATGLLINDPAAPPIRMTRDVDALIGDYLMSHDIEDIIAVLDGRPSITQEVRQSDLQLVNALAIEFQHLLDNRAFLDAIPAHMPTDSSSQARVPMVLETLRQLTTVP